MCTGVTRIDSGVRLLEFKPQLCYLLAVCPWAGYFLSLCFSFSSIKYGYFEGQGLEHALYIPPLTIVSLVLEQSKDMFREQIKSPMIVLASVHVLSASKMKRGILRLSHITPLTVSLAPQKNPYHGLLFQLNLGPGSDVRAHSLPMAKTG